MVENQNEKKQNPPETWRPYPPIREKLSDVPNKNYMINLALAQMMGIHQAIIDQYKREKK